MSAAGIRKFAKVMEILQLTRLELINMGSKSPTTASGHCDLKLGNLLDKAKDAVKDDFNKILAELPTEAAAEL